MLKICTFATHDYHDYWLLHTVYNFHDMVSVGSLNWGYALINGAYRWRHTCGQVTFPGNAFCCESFYLKYKLPHKLWSWSLDVKKGNVKFTDQKTFLENVTWINWWNHWPTSFIKEYPQCKLLLHEMAAHL